MTEALLASCEKSKQFECYRCKSRERNPHRQSSECPHRIRSRCIRFKSPECAAFCFSFVSLCSNGYSSISLTASNYMTIGSTYYGDYIVPGMTEDEQMRKAKSASIAAQSNDHVGKMPSIIDLVDDGETPSPTPSCIYQT